MAGQTIPSWLMAVLLLELSDAKTEMVVMVHPSLSRQDHLVIPATEVSGICTGLSIFESALLF